MAYKNFRPIISYYKALQSLVPHADFYVEDNDWNRVTWRDDRSQPSKADADAEVDRLQALSDAQAYARNRQAEYPDWGTQLNKIYDDGLTKWKSEMVDPIKAKWPKDNSGPVE